jgi:uncharacterized OB-fold protein
MVSTRPLTPQEIADKGKEWYEQSIRAKVEPDHAGQVVIIDVDTGEYQLGDDARMVTRRMLEKKPDATLYGIRIGYPAMSKRGGSWNLSLR